MRGNQLDLIGGIHMKNYVEYYNKLSLSTLKEDYRRYSRLIGFYEMGNLTLSTNTLNDYRNRMKAIETVLDLKFNMSTYGLHANF